MIINSGEQKTRRIYPQTGDMYASIDVSSFSENFEIGLSGDSKYKFNFSSGKVFAQDFFVEDYGDSPLLLEMCFGIGGRDYRINERIVYADSGTYSIDSIYVKNNGASAVEVDVAIPFSQRPNISYSLYTSGDHNFSGDIYNSGDYRTYLFNTSGSSETEISFTRIPEYIDSGASDYFLFTHNQTGLNVSGSPINLFFDYDFGTVNEKIYLNKYVESYNTGYMNIYGIDHIVSSEPQYGLIDYFWTQDSTMNISFQYLSGSGKIYEDILTSGDGSGILSGHVSGYGLLDGLFTGYHYYATTGYSGYTYSTGNPNFYAYATGEAVLNYSVYGVGYESGFLCTGIISGTVTGIVSSGSGHFYFDEVEGIPVSADYDGGTINPCTGIFTGALGEYVNVEQDILEFYTGNFTGTANAIVRDKNLNNVWDLQVGSYSNSFSSFLDSGWQSGNYYLRSFDMVPNTVNELDFIISYNGYHGTEDVVEMTISNSYTGESIIFTGST